MKQIKLTREQYAIVDDVDFEWINQWRWYAVQKSGVFRAMRSIRKNNKKYRVIMSRLIMGNPKDKLVDHANGNTLDNRRSNLRVCNHTNNMRNRKIDSENNTSGYKGVSWSNCSKKWEVRIRYGGKKVHLGYFESPVIAALIYNLTAILRHGEFARLNRKVVA